ncbi:hypothetical protein ORG37_26305 [Rahnella perminowiae]|uniref:hypothetical protein n=1 Tax=Rahnella TaxID=34037 RepID=UPI001F0F3161|nr:MULTISPECIES: hypothetical protein [Rahnella]MCX2946592.1 hypothetical protein [Rahnella perminowiae]
MLPATITGLINGALTVPLDMGYLAWGYMDTDSRYAHQTQRFRMAEAIHNDILNYKHITNAVEIIFKEFDKYASVSQQKNAYRGAVSSMAGRFLTAKLIAIIGSAVLTRVSFIGAQSAKNWIGRMTMILLIGGMSERSIRMSESLAIEAPEIYALLRPHDYDLTYFLFEPAVKPFIDAVHAGVTRGQPVFDRIIDAVGRKLHVTQ